MNEYQLNNSLITTMLSMVFFTVVIISYYYIKYLEYLFKYRSKIKHIITD